MMLGLLAHPPLHDSRVLLRAGDSLLLFTDGVTEARSPADRDLYGDDRLRDLVASLHGRSADLIADVIQQVLLAFSGGKISDDTVVLVLAVPPAGAEQPARGQGHLAGRPARVPGGPRHHPAAQRHPAGLTRACGGRRCSAAAASPDPDARRQR
jgi:hypothetical protein